MPMIEDDIRDLATEQSYERGEEYYYDHHSITNIQKRGETLTADVFGSSDEPYHVTVELTAFTSSFFMEDYTAVESIAGAEWLSVKPELLAQLAEADYAYAKIDIYLHEGMLEEAMKAVDRQSYADYSTVEKVIDAVWQTHPDWAIKHCKKQAEPIMDGGKSKYYHHAVRWVEKAGRAYLAAKREEEWQRYLEDLIQKHARKYSLRPQLEGLRRISL